MARASRSSVPPESKKRKRDSISEAEPRKRPATDSKEIGLAGNNPLRIDQAVQILAVLEKLDNQGLLDRTFPLADDEQGKSLRVLLDGSPLSVIRAAIHHLWPISSHPRARPSVPATQQAHFCQTALSLLDQASYFPADLSIPDEQEPSSIPLSSSSRKYALLQTLPTGDYWSSLNNPLVPEQDLHNIPTGHAQLVSIIPDPPLLSTKPIPTLATYVPQSQHHYVPQKSRRIRRGAFLDYGHFSSFAPSFDQNAGELDRDEVGDFYWWKEQTRRAIENRLKQDPSISLDQPSSSSSSFPEMDDVEMSNSPPLPNGNGNLSLEEKEPLSSTFPPDQAAILNAGMAHLELEQNVQQILDHNSKALQRLEELQAIRISVGAIPQEGTEEWDTANAILNSLTLLTQLRPRPSQSSLDDPSPLIPPASVLHKLHHTLPLTEINKGWNGTLPANKPHAFRDDSTIKIISKAPQATTTTRSHAAAAQNSAATATAAAPSSPSFFTAASPSPYTYTPSTPQPYTATASGNWYNPKTYGSSQPNGVIANTVQRVVQSQYTPTPSSSAPPLPSHLRTSYTSSRG